MKDQAPFSGRQQARAARVRRGRCSIHTPPIIEGSSEGEGNPGHLEAETQHGRFPKIRGRSSRLGGSFANIDTDTGLSRSDAAQVRDRSLAKCARKFVDWTEEMALTMLKGSNEEMLRKAARGIKHWRIEDRQRYKLEEFMGLKGPVNSLASNMSAREVAGIALVQQVLQLYQAEPAMRFYHATFIDDRIRTKDLETCVDVRSFKRSVRAILAKAGVRDWYGVVEIQPYVTWQRGVGRDLAPHLHVLFWEKGKRSAKQLGALMSTSKRLLSFTGSPTVRVTERRGAGEIAHMAAYLWKAPERGANAFWSRITLNSFRQYDVRMRDDQAVRVIELLSCFDLNELMMSSGKTGKSVLTAVQREIRHQIKCDPDVNHRSRDNVQVIWALARRAAGKTRYRPVTVIR